MWKVMGPFEILIPVLKKKVKGRVLGFYGTAACRLIVPLPPMISPHSSPEAPRTTQARETSVSEGGNCTRNSDSTS